MNYRKLGGVSPIVGYTKRLVRRLQKVVDADVFYEMRYTSPFAKDVIEKVKHYDEDLCNTYVSTSFKNLQLYLLLKILYLVLKNLK